MPFAGIAAAQSGETGASYDEAKAQEIDRMLMCPVCPAQTIDQTEVPLAKQMRAQVRELLASGATRDEVLAWFSAPERYGPSVLAEPPRSGFLPDRLDCPRRCRRCGAGRGTAHPARDARPGAQMTAKVTAPPDRDDLQPYLAAVDRDLALDGRDSAGED